MRVITGDETGLLKLVDVMSNTSSRFGEQNRELGIKGLAWVVQNEEFFLARSNGLLEYYTVTGGELVCRDSVQVTLEGAVAGLVCNQEGTVSMYSSAGGVATFNRSAGGKIHDLQNMLTARGPVSSIAVNDSLVAVGGQENDVQLWDATKKEVLWSAKNVPHDFLSLRVPVWVTSLSFMRTNDCYSEHEIVTGTGHKHVRMYDVRAKRQPVLSIDIGDFRVTSIAPHIDGSSVFVGDTSGGFNIWDVRNSARTAVLSGATGSIRDCAVHPYGSTVATVSLDRFLRVYDCTNGYKSVSTVYLKNRMTSCILFDDFVRKAGQLSQMEDFESDNEDSSDGERVENSRKKVKSNNGAAVKVAPVASDSDGSDIDMSESDSDVSGS
ncbi:unnamed protein product, partial [Ectocarpus fasciculatus]